MPYPRPVRDCPCPAPDPPARRYLEPCLSVPLQYTYKSSMSLVLSIFKVLTGGLASLIYPPDPFGFVCDRRPTLGCIDPHRLLLFVEGYADRSKQLTSGRTGTDMLSGTIEPVDCP